MISYMIKNNKSFSSPVSVGHNSQKYMFFFPFVFVLSQNLPSDLIHLFTIITHNRRNSLLNLNNYNKIEK